MGNFDEKETLLGLQSDLLIHQILLNQARANPEALAVVSVDQTWTYGRLAQESARWAWTLLAHGAKPGSRVGVALPRRCDLLAALLGIWRANCAYVPLDLNYPTDWVTHIVADAELEYVFTDDPSPTWNLSAKVLASDGRVHDGPTILPEPDACDLAYLIFTSGTSGRPKGVKITHGNAANLAVWARDEFGKEELSAVLAATSICFDLSVFELFVPLTVGATVVLVESPLSIADVSPPHPPTLINTVPSVMAELLRLSALPPSICSVNLAGEPLSGDLLARVWACAQVRTVRNLYGPSETTTYSTCARLSREERRPAIGNPISNTQIYLLDERSNPVGPGEAGEIFISGAGVADGYWRRPELTNERFVANPFRDGWSLLYKTGDLGSWCEDGALDYHGRLDDQVKIRGVRVETAEIEARLRVQQNVHDAAVVAIAVDREDRRLAAFILPARAEPPVDLAGLRKALEVQLPVPMVPTIWRTVEHLPYLANGKLDRRALTRSLDNELTPSSAVESTPVKSLAALAAAEMAALLGIVEIGIDESFIEKGADSLMAARLAARLRERTSRPVPASAALNAQTPAALAALIAGLPAAPADPLAKDAARSRGSILLTAAQRNLWLFNRLYPCVNAHNIGIRLGWRSECALEDLLDHCTAFALAHPPLLSIGIEDGLAWRFNQTGPLARVIDETQLGKTGLARVMQEEIERPFDLASEPPWRALIVFRKSAPSSIILTFHQIVIDRQSIEVVLRDFARLAAGQKLLPEPIPRYRHVIDRLVAPSSDRLEDVRFWRDLFSTPIPNPSYAIKADEDRSRSRIRRSIDAEAVARIEDWARQRGTTSYRTLLATFAMGLAQRSGRSETLIGSAFSLRDAEPASDCIMGFLANALPLRIIVTEGESLDQLVARVHALVSDATIHGNCRPELVQEALLRANPAFAGVGLPVMFSFLPSIEACTRPADAPHFTAQEIFSPSIEGEIHVQVRWDKHEAYFVLDTAIGRSPCAAEHLADAWQVILDNLGARQSASADDPSLFEAMDRIACAAPGSVAIRDSGGMGLTYAALRDRALGIAAELAERDSVGPCGLLFASQTLSIASAFACLRQGVPFVPLNTCWSDERIQSAINRMGIETVLCDFGPDDAPRNFEAARRLSLRKQDFKPEQVTPFPRRRSSIAYVLLTSGTTGQPKGVAQSQANLAYHIGTYAERIGIGPGDRIALLTSFQFDAGLMDIFSALTSGASLHIWPLASRGLGGLDRWIAEEGITVFHSTPSVFRGLVKTASQLNPAVASVRAVVLGGETARRSDLEQFKRVFPREAVLVNGYGPTESTTATQAVFDHQSVVENNLLPIGLPIGDVRVSLVDEVGMPAVEIGEIQLSGAPLFLGYIDGPEDYRRIHVGPVQRRTYRTGDLARWDPNGGLIHLGRSDHQTKINGIRTETAEIEQLILDRAREIEEVAVVPVTLNATTHLIAFISAKPGTSIHLRDLESRLRAELPANLIPNRVVPLGRLPYLDNGKVDRRSLVRLAMRQTRRVPATANSASLTTGEALLATVWKNVLNLAERPGARDTFLGLGGRSLEALIAIEKLRQSGWHVPPRALLGRFSLTEAAGMIGVVKPDAPAISQRPGETEASPIQRSFWLAEQLSPGTPNNLVLLALHFPDLVAETSLTEALTFVVARHDLLRSKFVEVAGRLSRLAESVVRPVFRRYSCERILREIGTLDLPPELVQPFSLAEELPFRAAILSTSDGAELLVLVFHHIAVDAWSVDVIARDLSAAYHRVAAPGQLPPARPASSYYDATLRLSSALTSEVEGRQLAFWRDRFVAVPPEPPLAGEHEPRVPSARSAHRASRHISIDALSAIDALCAAQHLTRSVALLALWTITLWSHTGKTRMVIGVPVSLRMLPDEADVVGPLINVIPLPVSILVDRDFSSFAEVVGGTLREALENVQLPLERLVTALGITRGPIGSPIYEASFSYHRSFPKLDGSARVVPTYAGASAADLALTAEEDDAGMTLAIELQKGRFSAQRAKRMLDQFIHLVNELPKNTRMPLNEVDLLPPDQRRFLVRDLAAGRPAPIDPSRVVDCIRERATLTPAAPAFIGPWGTLSYGELIRETNLLAEMLRDSELGPGSVVTVEITPGRPEFAIGVLAIWMLGAAYMPVDPCWPAQLLDRARADAASSVAVRGKTVHRVATSARGQNAAVNLAKAEILYAMYTSGSTGRPKAATATAQGIQNRFSWMSDFIGSSSLLPITIQTTSSLYDSSVWQLFWPLTKGGRCVIPDPVTLIDANDLTKVDSGSRSQRDGHGAVGRCSTSSRHGIN
ncbi:amino acid adenylation domain-containing protein [Bradyrhizobium diazoefficiens]|uniref:amino acid adenylation domain-containing protein n=1 Tax=Bradyrhizobium diazoefficiens TaxID=1355477 RepID=UPI0038337A9B